MTAVSKSPRILVIRRRYLGDVVLLGPVLRSLRNHWPAGNITVMVDRAFAPILTLNSDVDQILHVPDGPTGWLRSIPIVLRARYTHVLDLDNRPRTAIVTRLTFAPTRVALHHGQAVVHPSAYTHHAIAKDNIFETRHITDYYGEALKPINIPFLTEPPRLAPRQEDLAFVRTLPVFSAIPENTPKLLLHPGSRSPHRIWPADRFAAVIDRLQSLGIAPILVSGPGEKNVVAEIQSHLKTPAHSIDQRLTIPQLAALFASAEVLLCHDSGPMHLAASVGTRVVALFSSQSVTAWKPVGDQHTTLQAPMPCNPCLSPGFCVPADSYHNHCVRHLSVDRVLEAVIRQLGRNA